MSTLELDQVVTLTPGATQRVKSLLTEKGLNGYGLRVFVGGGGCSGMQYGMTFVEAPGEFDQVIEMPMASAVAMRCGVLFLTLGSSIWFGSALAKRLRPGETGTSSAR